jgi:hypothetical protein
VPKSSTSKPARWISDPAYGAALIATVQLNRPGITFTALSFATAISRHRLGVINLGQQAMKYMEQIALEAMLDNETVAKLHARYYVVPAPTFWDMYLTTGDTHARRK